MPCICMWGGPGPCPCPHNPLNQYAHQNLQSWPQPQQGCVCPPTSEKTCENPTCPRQSHESRLKMKNM